MAKTPSLAELRAMSNDQLVADHDRVAQFGETNVNYYLAELARRDQDRQTRTMVWLTWVILVATIANVALTGVAVWAAFRT